MRVVKPMLWIVAAVLALLAARHWTEIMNQIRGWNLGPFVEGLFR
jgi:hypothetical protein